MHQPAPPSPTLPDANIREPLREGLITWYRQVRRVLPWRDTRDPYAIWVSEIMLQQTQVATVVPYYARFMTRFPNIHALATAPQEDVLSLWRGLGYYARARNLHKGAQYVVQHHGGEVPQNQKAIRDIPGIGRYTAGAILSIAFGQSVPLLDGNVSRLFSRLWCLEADPKSHAGQKYLWTLAEWLVPGESPGDLNQALMELGATLCSPEQPTCHSCPARSQCGAASLPDPSVFPRKSPRRERPSARAFTLALTRDDGAMLFAQRPESGLLGGLWEWPTLLMEKGETAVTAFQRVGQVRLGLDLSKPDKITKVTHLFTHLKLELWVGQIRWPLEGLVQSNERALPCPASTGAALPSPAIPPPAPETLARVSMDSVEIQDLSRSHPMFRALLGPAPLPNGLRKAIAQLQPRYPGARWVSPSALPALPIGKATLKALKLLGNLDEVPQLTLF